MIKTPKKLIEVALPLDAINVAAAREKSIRHGHPSTLHLWWARRRWRRAGRDVELHDLVTALHGEGLDVLLIGAFGGRPARLAGRARLSL